MLNETAMQRDGENLAGLAVCIVVECAIRKTDRWTSDCRARFMIQSLARFRWASPLFREMPIAALSAGHPSSCKVNGQPLANRLVSNLVASSREDR